MKISRFFISLICCWTLFTGTTAHGILTTPREVLSNLTFAPIVEKISPAIVHIYAKSALRRKIRSPLYANKGSRHLFGIDKGIVLTLPRIEFALGSGVIVRKDGLIITNSDVVRGGTDLWVVLNDQREFPVKLIKKDKHSNLAALKIITKEKLTFNFVPLRDSDKLHPGDMALCIASPFGLNPMISTGVISGLARAALGKSSLIQTIANCHVGGGGGGLFDLQGNLIGINLPVNNRSFGFATPSNLIAPIIANADDTSTLKVIRAWAGVEIQDIDQDMAAALGLDKPQGVIIRGIFPNSPAEKAGLKTNDVILTIDEKPVANRSSYRFRIAIQNLGAKVPFIINRDGEELKITVKLEAPPGADEEPVILINHHRLEGAIIAKLTPALANELNLPYAEKGLIILDIKSGTPAARSGLFRTGDIILGVNGVQVKSAHKLDSMLARRSTRRIKLKRRDKIIDISFR